MLTSWWQEHLPWLSAAALAVAVVFLLLRNWWVRASRRWRILRRLHHAQDGERRAAGVLRDHGYQIEAVQPRTNWMLTCDGHPLPIELRADLLVNRNGRRYVVDVKTGARATKLTTAATRRQLLEYRMAYAVDGVLLVDVDQERVHQVGFQLVPSG